MKRLLLLLGLGLICLLSIVEASALFLETRNIQGFHVVKNLPDAMVAGSTYEWEVSFVNPKSEKGIVNITLEITEKKTVVGMAEFAVVGTFEAYDNPPMQHHYSTLTFTEVKGGVFQSQTAVEKRFSCINLKISSVPNLMPGTYNFTLTVTLRYEKQ